MKVVGMLLNILSIVNSLLFHFNIVDGGTAEDEDTDDVNGTLPLINLSRLFVNFIMKSFCA